jgi:hypothetical protein
MKAFLDQLRQLLCGLRGHDEVLHREPDRLALRCLVCGHQTRGWSLGPESHFVPPMSERFLGAGMTGFRRLQAAMAAAVISGLAALAVAPAMRHRDRRPRTLL